MASLLPTPEPADPVEGQPGHFEHSNWVKASVKALDAGLVHKDGDTMTGPLVLSGAPTAPLGAATKAYVDSRAVALFGHREISTPNGIIVWGSSYGQALGWTFNAAGGTIAIPERGLYLVTIQTPVTGVAHLQLRRWNGAGWDIAWYFNGNSSYSAVLLLEPAPYAVFWIGGATLPLDTLASMFSLTRVG